MKTAVCLFALFCLPFLVNAQKVFEISYTLRSTTYRVALILWDDGSGLSRTRFYSDGSTRMVEQTVKRENTVYGLRLAGYSPVYPGTRTRYSSYTPDNYYLRQDENGEYSITNIDDRGEVAACSIRLVEGYYEKNRFLSDFNWKL